MTQIVLKVQPQGFGQVLEISWVTQWLSLMLEYHIFYNLASRDDRRGTLGFPGTKSNSKRQDFKGQPLFWF